MRVITADADDGHMIMKRVLAVPLCISKQDDARDEHDEDSEDNGDVEEEEEDMTMIMDDNYDGDSFMDEKWCVVYFKS